VATENNLVYALDASDGKVFWRRSLGSPVQSSTLPCGNIRPILGITGTPAIDERRAAVYLDAMVVGKQRLEPRHLVFGLSLKDGSILPGFPIDVGDAVKLSGVSFMPRRQNQRGALLINADTLFIPYGGHFGDCESYHGWIVGISLSKPSNVSAWVTRGAGGGVWAPGGISFVGQSLFFAAGNTKGADEWSDGEAVFRLNPSLARSTDPHDFFALSDWRSRDETDEDLGCTNVLPLDVTDMSGGAHLLFAVGKDSKAYLLSRENLGGIGHPIAAEQISNTPIRTSPATFGRKDVAFVAIQGRGSECPNQTSNSGLMMLRIEAHQTLVISTEWCRPLDGRGSPIVTTTDGSSNPIVWIIGAEGDNRIHGFKGDNGEPIFTGGGAGDESPNVRHFATILAADGRLFAAGDGRIYAFTTTSD
jgi:hypothetical protein